MKTVLINGGSRGIGSACVRAFANSGYRVAFTYCNSQKEAECLAKETNAIPLRADSGKREEAFAAVDAAYAALGKIDVLVNNAGISHSGLFHEVKAETWERLSAVNLSGPFWFSQAVLPHMIRAKKGAIVNISSMWGVVGASFEVAYSATKAGVIGLTKALAKEVGPSGITVNAIAPGVIKTDMNAAYSREDMEALEEATPLGRIGTPEEVAALAVFLAGESGAFITGQTILQDGGFANC